MLSNHGNSENYFSQMNCHFISLMAVAPSTATTAREPMRAAAAETLSWVRSQETGHELLKLQAPLPFTQPKGPPSLPSLTVNVSKQLQPIIGFGGALTESSASVFAKLTPSAQAAFMEAYFGVSGNRYSLARTHIASCDFALSFYSYHEEPGDFEMKSFNMSRDFELLIPFIQRAKAAVEGSKSGALPFRLVSSPWSPPKWLKTCGELICPVLACGLRAEAPNTPYRTAYATYIGKYLDTMTQAGLKPFAITPQNEPNSCKPAMETMRFERDEEAAFIAQQLGPMLRAKHPDVKLLAYAHHTDALLDCR
jgi:glucosylceramidase